MQISITSRPSYNQIMSRRCQRSSTLSKVCLPSSEKSRKLPVTHKQTHKQPYYFEVKKKIWIDQMGLPNLGNTCFLNCTIQLLFAAESFREALILEDEKPVTEHSKTNLRLSNEDQCIKDLIRVFKQMKQRVPINSFLVEPLSRILKVLQVKNLSYRLYEQEDAFQTLLSLLSCLSGSLTEAFRATYTLQCACHSRPLQFQQLWVLSGNMQNCSECSQKLQFKLTHQPKYLIVKLQKNQLAAQNFYEGKYQLRAMVLYSKYGSVGHYVTHRIHEGQWYRCNDGTVTKLGRNILGYYHQQCLIAMYEIEECQSEPWERKNTSQDVESHKLSCPLFDGRYNGLIHHCRSK